MAFQSLKQALTSAPIVAYPVPGELYILDTDASKYCSNQEAKQSVSQLSKVSVATDSPAWITDRANSEKRECQHQDKIISPVLALREKCTERPPWDQISHFPSEVKSYLGLWNLFRITDGIFFKKVHDQVKGNTLHLVLPEKLF